MTRLVVPVCLSLVLYASATLAQDAKPQQPPAMDPKMIEAMEKAATPGEAHRKLDAFVGNWDTKITFWMAPGTEGMVHGGVTENRWVLGGRALEGRFTGTAMGMPFEGIGYTGYDNLKKQYWGTWIDNMSTALTSTTGSLQGNVYRFTGTMLDPMTGKDAPVEEKLTVVNADQHTMEMWCPGPDGKMFKNIEVVYTRKK